MAHPFRLKMFLIIWFLIGAATNVRNQLEFNLQHAGVDALVEHGTLELGLSPLPIFRPGGDTFQFEGKTYANKQPGQFLFGAAAYAPLRSFGLSYEKSYETVSVLVTWLSTGLLSALAAVALYELLLIWNRSRREASVCALLFTFGTPLAGYFGVLYHDVIAADCFVITLAATEIYRVTSRTRWIIASGFALGASISATMLAAAAAPFLFLLAFLRANGKSRVGLVIGLILGLAPLPLYNWLYFHNPFLVGYVALNDPYVVPRFDLSHVGPGLLAYTFRGDVALLKYYPILLFGFAGLFFAGPLRRVERACLLLSVAAHLVFVAALPTNGVCQNPPRFLLPLSGLLVLGLPWLWNAACVGSRRLILRASLGVGAALSLVCGLTGALFGAMNCGLGGWLTGRQLLQLGPRLTERNFPLWEPCVAGLVALVAFRAAAERAYMPRPARALQAGRLGRFGFSRNFLRAAEFPEFLLGAAAVALAIIRFFFLETSPPGFYIDENAAATTALCFRDDGIDSQGNPVGMFARALGGGDFTPIFFRGAALWSMIFGHSIGAFRAFSAFFSVLAIWGIFRTGELIGGRRGGLYCALCAAVSPWLFQFARVFWDPALVPCFLAWGIFFFLRGGRSAREPILSAVFFAAAAYSYPSSRAQVPLLIGAVVLTSVLARNFSWRRTTILGAAFSIFCAPLLILILSGSLLGRFELVSVLANDYLSSRGRPESLSAGIDETLMNFPEHFAPEFLFIAGDANPRHGTGKKGVLSWVDALALGAGLSLLPWAAAGFRLPRLQLRGAPFLIFAGIITGILPSALTWESIPHALRSIGAAPFVALMSGLTLAVWAQQFPRTVAWLTLLVTATFSVSFYSDYFFDYPRRAAESFDLSRNIYARAVERDGDWDAVFRRVAANTSDQGSYAEDTMKFSLITRAGLSCREALESASRLRRSFVFHSRSELRNE